MAVGLLNLGMPVFANRNWPYGLIHSLAYVRRDAVDVLHSIRGSCHPGMEWPHS